MMVSKKSICGVRFNFVVQRTVRRFTPQFLRACIWSFFEIIDGRRFPDA